MSISLLLIPLFKKRTIFHLWSTLNVTRWNPVFLNTTFNKHVQSYKLLWKSAYNFNILGKDYLPCKNQMEDRSKRSQQNPLLRI